MDRMVEQGARVEDCEIQLRALEVLDASTEDLQASPLGREAERFPLDQARALSHQA